MFDKSKQSLMFLKNDISFGQETLVKQVSEEQKDQKNK